MNDRYIYLAAPYSHPDPGVRELRYVAANRAAAELMKRGWTVYSPISHNHPIAVDHDLPTGWDFWGKMDRIFIKHALMLVVLMRPGWRESHGIKEEVKIAKEFSVPIVYFNPSTNDWYYFAPRGTLATPPEH